jgi:hypothetical protein
MATAGPNCRPEVLENGGLGANGAFSDADPPVWVYLPERAVSAQTGGPWDVVDYNARRLRVCEDAFL